MSTHYTLTTAPGGLPLVGHTLQLLVRPLQLFQSLRAHGDVVVIRLASTPIHVVNHPELIRQILTTDARKFDKGVQFEKARPYVGNGLATSSEPLHLRQRRLIQPAFHRAQIALYLQTMQATAREMIAAWPQGQPIELDRRLFEFTIRVLTETLFSTEADARVIREITGSLPDFLDGIAWRVAIPAELVERLPLPANRRFREGRERLRAIIDALIAGHRGAVDQREDLLSMLLAAREEETGAGMSDAQIRDEITTMMLAGTETSASTIGWVCHLLAEHPDVQERLQREVDTVLDGRAAGVEDLSRLVFMRHVISEALRMYPPAWLISRRPLEDVDLGGHRLRAGSQVFFSAYGVHRDPELYPDPDRFRPERWAEEQTKAVARAAFLPFGAGVRGCIGEPFAWAESTVFLATLVGARSLHLVPGRPVKAVARGTLRPQNLHVLTRPRAG
ncbi:cytochrome P450 [Polyangium aurulentum]|uniref:cytochrome P450 n=1 Tax=Polyangium aurulentum TaxID=2567896 RepID=UPI0010AE43CC|nr:cytochrome P450 [Polyangium aurulentum]UQA57274.1 cytochrome P450 [Polyangium aurulentum]